MARYPTAESFLPPNRDTVSLARAVEDCRGCDLWERATQAVFGAGPAIADLMLVGEQPGDSEDAEGKPFVGPAGRLLDEALAEAGIDRSHVYVTNAVKHFKWKQEGGGKRRIHDKPNASEVEACRPWFQAELEAVKPRVLMALGATAARAMLGPAFRLTRDRGRFVPSPLAPRVLATVHPSSLLRIPDEDERHEAMKRLVDDLRVAARAVRETASG